ncbi:MAG: hypothetical protein JWN43_3869, partial [Gammaproteobacteria bacterium]|nr:hypothetical protein [Gammaproteobacteria bacterium]
MLLPKVGDEYLLGLLGGQTKVLSILSYKEPPEHTAYRSATGASFMPSEIRKLEPRFREIAKETVDDLLYNHDGECDFVEVVAKDYPLKVIMEMLGIPKEDHGYLHRLTQETFGGDDPDMKRDDVAETTAETGARQWLLAVNDAYDYFENVRKDRWANPRGDMATAIAMSRLKDGQAMPERIQNHLMVSVAIAGHDTINSALSGGLLGLTRFPDELQRVKADMSLVPGLVDECIRYATPTKHFMRNTTQNTDFHGLKLRPMERLMCLLVSANRDESVFHDPNRFDVTRRPNPHLSFSYGPHVCLGQHIAKIEMRALFDELLPRISDVSLTAEPTLKRGNFVTGVKTLPVRFVKA